MAWQLPSLLHRRAALTSLGTSLSRVGLLAVVGAWSQACGRALFKGGGIGTNHLDDRASNDSGASSPELERPIETKVEPISEAERNSVSQLLNCDVFSKPNIDTAKLEPASGDLIPSVRFYGNKNWALIAFQFSTSKEIQTVTVLHMDGSPIALHVINPADKGPRGYRPAILENLPLKGVPRIKFVVTVASKSVVYEVPVAFVSTFNGLPVVDLGNKIVVPEFAANQSVAQFAETAGSFRKDSTVTYPNDFNGGVVRNLQTAVATSTWSQGAGVKGEITDIMGNILPDLNGGALLEYQTFCTYVLGQNQYFRTTLKVG